MYLSNINSKEDNYKKHKSARNQNQAIAMTRFAVAVLQGEYAVGHTTITLHTTSCYQK